MQEGVTRLTNGALLQAEMGRPMKLIVDIGCEIRACESGNADEQTL